MKFILAKKLKMTQVFDQAGKVIPVTLVEAGPCLITQVKTKEKDGYQSVQIGFDKKRSKLINKAQKGSLAKLKKINSALEDKDLEIRHLREFRVDKAEEYKVGELIKADIFEAGDKIKITGLSKGKGFQGVVKRHGFSGGPASHGNKHSERSPGSIGSGWPERVFKGKRMAGRMGYELVTVKGLKIISVDPAENVLAISGAVPGSPGTLFKIIKQ